MGNRCAKDNRPLVANVFDPRLDDELIALGKVEFRLQISNIILKTIESYFRYIDICMNAYTTHRHEHADIDSRFEIEFVRRILKDIENDLVVIGALGRRREPKRKLRLKLSQH